ncbi:MAG: hypothetical protein AAF497_07705 [Planctomycetota bacterium]
MPQRSDRRPLLVLDGTPVRDNIKPDKADDDLMATGYSRLIFEFARMTSQDQTATDQIHFKYHPKKWLLGIAIFVTLVPASVLLLFAFFVRGPAAFTFVFFIISTVAIAAFFFFVSRLSQVLTDPPMIRLSHDAITTPVSPWGKKRAVVPYDELRDVSVHLSPRGRCLVLIGEKRNYALEEFCIENRERFDQLYSVLDRVVRSRDADAIVSEERRVPCSLCDCGVPISISEETNGLCPNCARLEPDDFRREGGRMLGLGAGIALVSIAASVLMWKVFSVVWIAVGLILVGLMVMGAGAYTMITGKPIRIAL